MPEQGDIDLFAGPAPSEKKEGSDKKFQDEMTLKLVDWQLEHQVSVSALLRTIANPTQHGYSAMIAFFKLEPGDIEKLKKIKEDLTKELNPDAKKETKN